MNPGYLFLFKAILFGAITIAAAIFSVLVFVSTPWGAGGYRGIAAGIGAISLGISLLVLIISAAEAWSSWIIFKSGEVAAFSHKSKALFSFNILISVALILIFIITLYLFAGTAGIPPQTFLALALCLLFIPDLIAINAARGHQVLLAAVLALTIPTFFITTYFSIRYASDSLQEIAQSQKRDQLETVAIQQAAEIKDENELPALLAGKGDDYDGYYYREALAENLPDNFITDSEIILRSIEPERFLEDSLLESLLDKTRDFPRRLEQDTVLQQLLFKDFPDIGAKYFKYLPESERSSEAFVFTFFTDLTESHLVHSIYDLDGRDDEWLEYIDPSLRGDEAFLLRLLSHNASQSQGIVFEHLVRYEERYVNATEKRLVPVVNLPCMRIRRLVQKVAAPELLLNHSFIEHLDQHVKGIGPCLKADVD